MRVRHKPWAEGKLNDYSQWVVSDPESQKGKWSELFGNDRPIHIEIGTGKGQFITGMAKTHPDLNFIGIELQASILVEALDKLLEAPQENLRLLHINATDLAKIFDAKEIAVIYLNFSDPWPKNRHEKRRLTHANFLGSYQQILTENGRIELKTDNQGLFEYSLESFSLKGFQIKNVNLNLHAIDVLGNIKTEYEEKFSSKGQRIYRCEAWLF